MRKSVQKETILKIISSIQNKLVDILINEKEKYIYYISTIKQYFSTISICCLNVNTININYEWIWLKMNESGDDIYQYVSIHMMCIDT